MVSSIQQVILNLLHFFQTQSFDIFFCRGREMNPIYIEVNLILGIEL